MAEGVRCQQQRLQAASDHGGMEGEIVLQERQAFEKRTSSRMMVEGRQHILDIGADAAADIDGSIGLAGLGGPS